MTTKSATFRVFTLVLLLNPALSIAEQDESNWNNTLKNQYFSGKSIEESNSVIELDAPIRAEDPALVPLKIVSKLKQTQDHYIKKILVLVDKNPSLSSASLNLPLIAAKLTLRCAFESIVTAISGPLPK